MTVSDRSGDETYLEVLDASAILDELSDAARVEAWASSVLGVWGEDPDAGAIDADFVDWLKDSNDPRASLVLLAISSVLELDSGAVASARDQLEPAPRWFDHLHSAKATRAWVVNDGLATSVGIGFLLSDGSEHSLLGDIVEDELCSLVVAPGPDELFDGSEDLVAPQSIAVGEAAVQIVAGWKAIAGRPHTPESVYVNSAIAHRRLSQLTGEPLNALFRPDHGAPATAAGSDVNIRTAEENELDGWALAQLDIVGVGAGTAGPTVLLDAIDPLRIATYPAAEREAFAALEWADWLGMIIGLSRASVGVRVDPAMLVDQINRCPEVTSSIPKKDRAYFEWAFSMLLPLWRRGEVLDAHDRLTPDGAAMLVAAVREVWGDS